MGKKHFICTHTWLNEDAKKQGTEFTSNMTEQEFFDYGDRPMGIIPDQDVAITTGQQLGLRSRGFQRATAAGQEDRISWLHSIIDEYMNGQRP